MNRAQTLPAPDLGEKVFCVVWGHPGPQKRRVLQIGCEGQQISQELELVGHAANLGHHLLDLRD